MLLYIVTQLDLELPAARCAHTESTLLKYTCILAYFKNLTKSR